MWLLLLTAATAAQEETPRTASVQLYADVDALVSRADALAAEGRWREVVDIYAAAMDSHRDALVSAGGEPIVIS